MLVQLSLLSCTPIFPNERNLPWVPIGEAYLDTSCNLEPIPAYVSQTQADAHL